MKGYIANIEKDTLENKNFRKVLYTGKNMQLVVMTLQPGEDIGAEVHEEHDQFLRVEKGTGTAVIDGNEQTIQDDWAVIVPAGAEHNIINTSDTEVLQLYTLYAPPEHKEGTVHATKADALAQEEHFDGETTE